MDGNNMESEIILEEEYVTLSYSRAKRLLSVKWKEKVTSEEYRKTFNKAIEKGNQSTVHYFVSDITKSKIVAPEDRRWFEEIILPKAIKAGLRKGAVVYDGNIFKKYYLTNIMNKTKSFELPLKFFGNIDEAEKWLLEE